MFTFIRSFSEQLYKRSKTIDTIIMASDASIFLSMQEYIEYAFKLIYKKEYSRFNLTKDPKSLGEFLYNNKFILFIKNEIKFSAIDDLNKLIYFCNNYKKKFLNDPHEVILKKFYQLIFEFSKCIVNYYVKEEIGCEFNENNYKELINNNLKSFNLLKSNYHDLIKKNNLEVKRKINQYIEERDRLNSQLDKILNKHDQLKSKFTNEFINKTLKEKDELINQLNEEISILKEQTSNSIEVDSITEEVNEEIDRLTVELNKTNSVYNELLKGNVGQVLKDEFRKINDELEQYKIRIEEKNTEIEILKKDLKDENEKINSYDLLLKFKISKQNTIYTSSYEDSDASFVVNDLSLNSKCESKYKSYYAVIHNLLQRGQEIKKSPYLCSLNLFKEQYIEVYKLEIVILLLIKNNKLNDKEWSINYINGNIDLLKCAIQDIMWYMNILCSLSKEHYINPYVKLNNSNYDNKYVNISYDENNYQNVYNFEDYSLSNDDYNLWIDDKIKYNITLSDEKNVCLLLELLFNHKTFRIGQYKILMNTLNGNSTIGILPTGGGKSLIYQLTGLLQPKMTLVVAPINSLIKDQIENLSRRHNITRVLNLTAINSKVNMPLFKGVKGIFTFVSPERLQMLEFRKALIALSGDETIDTVILDEVHCLSEWGHDFRISYLMLAHTLNTYCKNMQFIGLTATASLRVIKDLMVELHVKKKDVIFTKNLKRENLEFGVFEYDSLDSMRNKLKILFQINYGKNNDLDIRLNGNDTNSVVVFTKTKKEAEDLCNDFSKDFKNEVAYFHGESKNSQDDFINNDKSLLFATKAFGMGIDKPNVRRTYHFGIPSSRENFFQEAGRAGRDGNSSKCGILTYESKEYENLVEEFLDINTTVDRMKEIEKLLIKKTDISTNLFFLVDGIEDPIVEAEYIYEQYCKYIEGIKDNFLILNNLNKNQKVKTEKTIYFLHKLGIVDNWNVVFVNGIKYVDINVKFTNMYQDFAYIRETSVKYISSYGDDKIIEQIRILKDINDLKKLFTIVSYWYFDSFVRMRREQLANMYYFTKKYRGLNVSEDIQNELEQFFDLSSLVDENQQYSLLFENEEISNIVIYAGTLDKPFLAQRIIELEHILESTTNYRTEIYTGLINLRAGEFAGRNGKDRLLHGMKSLNVNQLNSFYQEIAISFYNELDNKTKSTLLDFLFEFREDIFKDYFMINILLDEHIYPYAFSFINNNMKGIMA